MPRWVVNCPLCKKEFIHSEIERSILEQAGRDPFGVLYKPADEKRICPNCGTESPFASHQLFYREGKRL